MKGLTQKEVAQRRARYGYNELQEKNESKLELLVKKLWGPIPWMIELAAILSIVLRDWVDFVIILILLFVNVGVDYVQEGKAVSALAKLKSQLIHKVLVYREGGYQHINARELVPDDVIKLKIGDVVPADVVLIEGDYLQVDQSALTGESLPVTKKVNDELYSGSAIKHGEMIARVQTIGMDTYAGKNAALITQASEKEVSHFQKAIIHIGRFLIVLSVLLSMLILTVSIMREDSLVKELRFVLVLLVASIPVALPAVLSVTMAIGALAIARKNAIVRNIAAIEELAGTDILCSDKTGTLTQNKLKINEPIVYRNYTERDLFRYAVLSSEQENDDPIEIPIFNYFSEQYPEEHVDEWNVTSFKAFNPVDKYAQATVEHEGHTHTIIKGAPQVIAKKIQDQELKETFLADINTLAQKGYRSLSVGYLDANNDSFHVIGTIPFFDPPREDSTAVIKNIRNMGINIKMLTGDNQAIAKEIASMLKIGTNILPIEQMRAGDMYKEQTVLAEVIAKGLYRKFDAHVTDEAVEAFGKKIAAEVQEHLDGLALQENYVKKHESEIIQLIEKADGFSEVFPEDKYYIIEKLQKNKHFVAMTGDGVNDAPALKKADVGIAVSGASDAARAASDLVLLEPGLSVIEDAIKAARQTFERMKGYATFRIAETLRIILFITLSILMFNSYPITALMIIMLALLNDIPVMMIAYDNAPSSEKPVHWNMKEVLAVSSVLGVAGVVSSFAVFFFLHAQGYPLAIIQSILFLKLDIAGHSTLYLTRTGRKNFWEKPYPSLKFWIPTFTTRIIGTLIAVYGFLMEPIGWYIAILIWVYAFVWWIFNNFLKKWTYLFLDRHEKTKMSYATMKEMHPNNLASAGSV